MSEQTATWFNHYDVRPEAEVPAESPLAWSYQQSGRPAASQKSRVVLRERPMLGHLILESKLREALGDAHYAIVNVSGAQTLVELEGDKARELLMKSTPYDVHPSAFPVGKGVTTVFAKANLILRRTGETRWELVLRRSFADYCYRWLLDAGAEYAIGVEA